MKNVCVWLTLAVSILGCGSPKDNRSGQEETKPLNVLFIVVDDLNKTLGCYDHPLVKTPHIDGLAARGIQFDQAHCNFAVCNPSRSSFLTGMTPETTTIQDNRLPLQEIIGDWVTLPALFRQNGYYTMSLGKIFHGNAEKHNDPKAWDEIYGFGASELGRTGEGRNMTDGKLKWCSWLAAEGSDEDQADGQNAKKAVEFLKSDHEKPFFLAVGFHKPHDPFNAPKNYFDLYPIEDCDPPVLPEGWEPPYEHSLPGETDVFNKFTDREKREFLRSYYACCSFMDAQVGKVLQALEESGQAEHTLIVFFGDHGYHLGEHNWWNKVTIYEKGSSAPFILAGGPVEKKGIRSDAMFEFIDIYPTLAELCALEDTPDYLEGRSFATLIQDPSQSFRSEVRAIVRRGEKTGRMVKNSQWRYIEWDQGRMGNELYDQLKDPIEYHNLAGDPAYAEVVADMKALIHLDH
jgi:uncharacterized sulfatase